MNTSHRVRKIHSHLSNQGQGHLTVKTIPRQQTPENLLDRARGREAANVARAGEMETLECAWYVGKRRPLSDLPFWKRWLVRAVYFSVGWCTGDGIEAQAICTSKELAEEMAKEDGWFYHELPINVPLPDETCRFRAHVFPASEASGRYEHLRLPVAAVRVSEIEQLERKVEQVIRSASA